MDQQVPTEALAEVGCWSIPPETDIFLSGSQNWRLIIFLAPTMYFHLFTFEKAAWPISEPTYFANYSATRYKPSKM